MTADKEELSEFAAGDESDASGWDETKILNPSRDASEDLLEIDVLSEPDDVAATVVEQDTIVLHDGDEIEAQGVIDDVAADDLATREFDPFADDGEDDVATREFDPLADDDKTVVSAAVKPEPAPTKPRRIVRTSALAVPGGPKPAGVPPTAKPVRLMSGANRSALPPAIPPASIPPELPGWDTITSGKPIRVGSEPQSDTGTDAVVELPPSITPASELPAATARAIAPNPRSAVVASEPVPAVAAPIVPRQPGWRWWQLALTYLVLFALMALAGWFFWMWFARDELAAQRESVTDAQGQVAIVAESRPAPDADGFGRYGLTVTNGGRG